MLLAGQWKDDETGSFTDTTKWDDATVPTAGKPATFGADAAGTFTVTIPPGQQSKLTIEKGAKPTFSLGANTFKADSFNRPLK